VQLCHAVDPDHLGKENAAVAFVAACPTTKVNKQFVKAQLDAVLAGRPPPQHEGSTDLWETRMKDYSGQESFSEEARAAFGYNL